MRIKRQICYLLLIISVLGLCAWYYAQPSYTRVLSQQELAQLPDAIATQIHAKQFDEIGDLTSELKARRIVHYPEDNQSYLDHPEMVDLNNNEQEPWFVKAKHGRSLYGTHLITLWDDVELMQPSGPNNVETIINTDQLTYDSQENVAYTEQPFELKQIGVLVTSIGMYADLDEEKIELLSEATGQFDHTDGIIDVSADQATINHKTGVNHYYGNVRFNQHVTELLADRATTEVDENQHLIRALAEGNSSKRASYRTQNDEGDHLLGIADKIYYFADKQQIVLQGNASVMHNNDSYQAENIYYDLEQQRVLSPGNDSARTEIILYRE